VAYIYHCSGDFWTIRTVQLKNHQVLTCWQNFYPNGGRHSSNNPKFPSSIETLRMLLQYEMTLSLLKKLMQDPEDQIKIKQNMNLLTNFNLIQLWTKYWRRRLKHGCNFLSLLFSTDDCHPIKKIKIRLSLHIGRAQPNKNPPATTNKSNANQRLKMWLKWKYETLKTVTFCVVLSASNQ